MRVVFLGPAHPYRGGLATIMQSMAREFRAMGHSVSMKTFSLQYPAFLFPGESQTLDTPPPSDLDIKRVVNTINPLSWIRVGLELRRERPDIIVMKYWTPFMAPCFGTIARIARSNGHTKVICQVDNVKPHEHHIIDRPCNGYYLKSVDGFIYMSHHVGEELDEYTNVPKLFSPHPMFENLGQRVTKEQAAAALNLDESQHYALFFGLIRDYKGLDILIDAWDLLHKKGVTEGRKLIIAGEFYTSCEPYLKQIQEHGLQEEIILHDRFIADELVSNYFSISDFLVLPYRTATQSGVTQIAYNFSTPMVVTHVGGLPEIVPHGVVGLNCAPSPQSVADAMELSWSGENLTNFQKGLATERRRFSWRAMCERIVELYNQITE